MATSLELENDPKVIDNEYKKDEEEFSYALQLAFSCVLPMSLYTAIELGVFDIISKAGEDSKLSSTEIAVQLATNNPNAPIILDRILRMLASHSVVSCSVVNGGDNNSNEPKFQRLYGLTPVSKYFVTNEDGISLAFVMAMAQDKIFLDTWSQLKHAVLEGGIPFNMVYGIHPYEYLGLDPRFNQVFNKAMYSISTISIKEFLKGYRGFNNIQDLVDVGGGLGVSLKLITSKYPHIKGINFDLPHVIEHAPLYSGVKHVGGNMFEKVPTGDAVFLKSVLHNWSDEYCLKLLKNCYKAIPENGKVIVMELTSTIKPNTSSVVKCNYQLDVVMMTQFEEAKERSQEELLALATGAGFSGIKFEFSVCNHWVMEFFK